MTEYDLAGATNGGRAGAMTIRTMPVGAFQENAYLVIDDETHRAALIDPGAEGERLLAAAREADAEIEAIWLTHAHVDHVGGIAAVKRARDVPVFMHPDGTPLYESAVQHGEFFGIPVEAPPPADATLEEGQTLRLGALAFTVMETPGHAPGHVVIHGHGVAFVGDCLFAGSIGRTDLPMSNGAELARSLSRICTLPDDTVVYPGHGPATTIGRERVANPFLNGVARIPGAS
jgi:glyoxylase-like metal-dependent hydrolase (beta-lactamase superfamily II)